MSTFEQQGGVVPHDYDRLVIVYNPAATHNTKRQDYINDLRAYSPFTSPVLIESKKDPAHTAEELAATTRDGDIIYALGGDGLANDIAQFVGSTDAPELVMMFSDLGNACNAYHATTEPGQTNQPSALLRNGRVEPIVPLRATVEGEESYSRLGLTVISVGAIATGAAVLNQQKHRESRFRKNPHTRYPYEIYLSLFKTLPKTRTLEVTDLDDAQTRPMLDIFAAHAPNIGKAAEFDVEITDEEFMLGTMKDRMPWHLGLGMLQLVRGTFPVELIKPGSEETAFRLTHSRRNRKALIQFDGEPVKLALGSTVLLDMPAFDDPRHQDIPVVTNRQANAQ